MRRVCRKNLQIISYNKVHPVSNPGFESFSGSEYYDSPRTTMTRRGLSLDCIHPLVDTNGR